MTKLVGLVVIILGLVVGSIGCTAIKTLQIEHVEVNEVTDTSAVIYWYSDDRQAGAVEYGLTEEYGMTVEESDPPKWTEYWDESTAEGKYMWQNQVQLKDLLPGTTYYYRIPGTWVSDSFTTKPAAEFKITSYEVENSFDGTFLRIQFTTNVYGVEVRFLDPSGSEVTEVLNSSSMRGISFGMARTNGPPVSGRWTFIANYEGVELARFTVDHSFTGTIVTVTKVTLDWDGGPSSYTLANVYVEATNSGDLPADVNALAEVSVDGKQTPVQPGIHTDIPPGGTETIALLGVDITDIPAGETTFKVVLKGPNGELVSVYSCTVTPS